MVKNENQSALWMKLASFEIGEGGESFTFENRLARENGWNHEYTHRVVDEYRKFVFLCAVAGHPCSPSEAVDEAWHLHMIYTRSYWDRLCPLLPAPLHHGPSKGGAAESAKFDDWYERTLASYRRLFGTEPPADIWPAAKDRFVDHTIRIDPRQFVVISKPALRRTTLTGVAAAVVLLTTVGWVNMLGQIDAGSAILGLFGLIMVGGIASAAAMSAKANPTKKKNDGSSCGSGGSSCGSSSSGDGGGSDGGGEGDGGSGCGGGGCGGGCGGGGCGS